MSFVKQIYTTYMSFVKQIYTLCQPSPTIFNTSAISEACISSACQWPTQNVCILQPSFHLPVIIAMISDPLVPTTFSWWCAYQVITCMYILCMYEMPLVWVLLSFTAGSVFACTLDKGGNAGRVPAVGSLSWWSVHSSFKQVNEELVWFSMWNDWCDVPRHYCYYLFTSTVTEKYNREQDCCLGTTQHLLTFVCMTKG